MKMCYAAIIPIITMLAPTTCLAEITVKPAGIQVVWDSMKDQFGGFTTFNASEGLSVTLAVETTDKGFIDFNKRESKVMISDGENDMGGKFGMWDRISEDAKSMSVVVESKKALQADVESFAVKGELSAVTASEKETKSTKLSKVKKGDLVDSIEGFEFEVEKLGKPEWGDEPHAITLKWQKDVSELAAVRFYDAEDKEIESSKGSSSSFSAFGKITSVTKTYRLSKKVDTLRMEFDLWSDLSEISIPFDLVISLSGAK